MVIAVSGTFRVTKVRFQDPIGKGSILVGEQIDGQGRTEGRATLRVAGDLSFGGRPFHVAQTVQFQGEEETWLNPRTGIEERQINVREWFEVRPRGSAWVEYVAGSPAFSGVGQRTARLVWDAVGIGVFELLTAGEPTLLAEAVPGLGEDKARVIVDAWRMSGQDRLVEWLDQHRLPRKLCRALLRVYADQDDAVSRLTADPYRLLAFGITWGLVDAIAHDAFDIMKDDPRRLHAAVVNVLMADYERGNTASPAVALTGGVARLLGADEDAACRALRFVFSDGGFVQVAEDLFQLRGVNVMENAIAVDLVKRCVAGQRLIHPWGHVPAVCDPDHEGSTPKLTDRQRAAVGNAFALPLSIVIGGAGTGKTACLAAVHRVVESFEGRKDAVIQMALAGRAAKRMREATGREATTIAGFLHNIEAKRLDHTTHVIIDEASMLDVPNLYAILRRLRGRANVVLVGDDFQLPPVGSGKILHLLAKREGVPITVLDKVWRQKEENAIRSVATAIRSGTVPELPEFDGPADGVFLAEAGQDVASTIRRLFEMLGGLSDDSDLRVITPRRRTGPASAFSLNQTIHRAHFSAGEHVVSNTVDTGFCVGDRFVCDVNHWDVGLTNGSLGRILRSATAAEVDEARGSAEEQELKATGVPVALVDLDGETRLLEDRHLLDCSWGYALTCHRAQGSDFSRIIVVLDQIADRSWLYTAITRGRSQVVLVGSRAQVDEIVATSPRVDDRRVGLDILLDRHRGDDAGAHRD